MEIERKFLVSLPDTIYENPHKHFVQGYLATNPTVRVRDEAGEYFLTYKGSGLLSHEEYNLPLTKEAFMHLIKKADNMVIEKDRYFIPYEENEKKYMIELDIYDKELKPLKVAEVEFESEEEANAFKGPAWFTKDVTYDKNYKNAVLSINGIPKDYK